MEDAAERAVLRAIHAMRERLGEQLTIDDLAKAAMFSKFHFTRIFQRVTGVSPGRFLSALRLQRAKRLLVTTTMTVADISINVGYNSVGTFSTRFSRQVGMSPSTYRRRSGYAPVIAIDTETRAGRPSNARITCRLRLAQPRDDAVIFVGVFPDQIPEGRPVRCAVAHNREKVQFDSVPAGTWYVLAQSVAPDGCHPVADCECVDRSVSVATFGPFTVQNAGLSIDLVLRPSRILDPPVLVALLDARKYAAAQLEIARRAPAPFLDQDVA